MRPGQTPGRTAAIAILWAWTIAAPAWAQATAPAGLIDPEAREADRKAKVEKLVVYFLDQYGKALEGQDWVNRSMAVISLSAIDEPRVTEKLLEDLSFSASEHVGEKIVVDAAYVVEHLGDYVHDEDLGKYIL